MQRCAFLTISLTLVSLCTGFPATFASAEVDYARDVQPLLARKCYACHGPDEAEGGFALHEPDRAVGELESGTTAIAPGNPDESEMIARIKETEPYLRMPPEEHDPLTAAEIAILEEWVEQGAKFDKHWAFKPLEPVEVPAAVSKAASDNPIDRFIDKQLQERELTAAPEADRLTLLRRLTYDLTGLPPTPEEVADFVNDVSPDAYEKVVDRLLASPHYGERWARHWLDVVRYAETNSFERDGTKPNAWKYRDYVIRSFNEDKPYNEFLREQLAGDEFENPEKHDLIASGFYRLGIWDDEPADPLLARYDEFDSIVTTISQGMLGLTVNCSRCHDHKIDPIPQADYYRMVAFLKGLTPYGTRGDQRTFSQTDVSSPELNARYAELDEQLRELRRKMRKIEQAGIEKMPAEDQRASETRQRKKLLEEKLLDFLNSEQTARYTEMKAEEEALQAAQRSLPPRETVLSVAKAAAHPEPTHIMLRGNPHVPGEEVQPGFPDLYGEPLPELPEVPADAHSSGRRTILANWIANDDNRLTSRVMVNRIWQHHFGRGIVRTPNNFGLLGTPPTHPELLNWLAQEFVAGGWKMKPLHKLIVMSEAYRRSSKAVPASLEKDPNNDFFWRFDLRRLSAEEIRDSVLAASGALNLKMFGPSMYPQLSDEVLSTQSKPGQGWGNSSLEERSRRSIYIFIKRSLIPPELAAFDFPETDVTCEARFTTIQPAQSLNMVNGAFLNQQADVFAARLRAERDTLAEQVERGWNLAVSRQPEADEMERSLALIDSLQTKHNLSKEESLKYFCLFLLNLNEFVFVD
ncbi:PSD1 and planctomycete cytochrome C domain-containing protein [Rubinisphaera sp. JC750]|uniref:PSD1 and planctomycete cytochrome C domain-containing protein n=1 Tax=Rubinisphaera sp. JC750 TaxID=2898658 RepID=UPI0021BCD297